MFRLICALFVLAPLPIFANATSTSSITTATCSSELASSLLNGASFACSGNLVLSGGFVTSDSLIDINATGDLFLDNISLTAPNISLSVLAGVLKMGGNVIFSAGSSVVVTGGNTLTPVNIGQLAPKLILSRDNLAIPLGSGSVIEINAGSGSSAVLNRVGGGHLTLVSGELRQTDIASVNTLSAVTSVPEPTTYAMLFSGMLALVLLRRRATR
jgi:hypothetical protein